MSGERGFDWPALLRAGLRDLGLTPREFWALTPAELWLMLGPEAGEMPMGRGRLDQLAAAYPDQVSDEGATDG